MNQKIKEYINIEEDFFDLDKENRLAHMKLEFVTPRDLFDTNSITKTPVFNDEFTEWLKASFEYAPKKCKIDLDIAFDDMGGYSEDELRDAFLKNTALEFKRHERLSNMKNKIAFFLIGIGLLLFTSMLLVLSLWKEENVWKQIYSYIADIAATVAFWEAMTILVVENTERRRYMRSRAMKFHSIDFHKKESAS